MLWQTFGFIFLLPVLSSNRLQHHVDMIACLFTRQWPAQGLGFSMSWVRNQPLPVIQALRVASRIRNISHTCLEDHSL